MNKREFNRVFLKDMPPLTALVALSFMFCLMAWAGVREKEIMAFNERLDKALKLPCCAPLEVGRAAGLPAGPLGFAHEE